MISFLYLSPFPSMERNTCIAFLRMHIYEENLRYVMIQIARRYVCVPRFFSFLYVLNKNVDHENNGSFSFSFGIFTMGSRENARVSSLVFSLRIASHSLLFFEPIVATQGPVLVPNTGRGNEGGANRPSPLYM